MCSARTRPTSITWPGSTPGLAISYDYDELNRVWKIRDSSTDYAVYAIDDMSRRSAATLGNSHTAAYTYWNTSALEPSDECG